MTCPALDGRVRSYNGQALVNAEGYAASDGTPWGACCFYNTAGEAIGCEDMNAVECVIAGGVPHAYDPGSGNPLTCGSINCEWRLPCCEYEDGELVGCEMKPFGECDTPKPFDWQCYEDGDDGSDPMWRTMRCDHPCSLDCPEPEPTPPDPPPCDFCSNAPMPSHVVVALSGFKWCPNAEGYPWGNCDLDTRHRLGLALERLLNAAYAVPAAGASSCVWQRSLIVFVSGVTGCGDPPDPLPIELNLTVAITQMAGSGLLQRQVGATITASGHHYVYSRIEPILLDPDSPCTPFGGPPTNVVVNCNCNFTDCKDRITAGGASLTAFV